MYINDMFAFEELKKLACAYRNSQIWNLLHMQIAREKAVSSVWLNFLWDV